MDIKKLTERVQFGVASPPYRSRSAGTDFEDVLRQLKTELKNIESSLESYCAKGTSAVSDSIINQITEGDILSQSQLLSMDQTEFSLLDDLLMSALEETRLKSKTKSALGAPASDLDSEITERMKLDIAKMSELFKMGL